MSRDIKFRAWDNCAEKMIIAGFDDGYTFIKSECGFDVYGDGGMNIYHLELMQYTGINDKNGIEIYEDDVVEDYEGRLCRVSYANGCFYSVLISDDCIHELLSDNSSLCEVIGNIYENPELLEIR